MFNAMYRGSAPGGLNRVVWNGDWDRPIQDAYSPTRMSDAYSLAESDDEIQRWTWGE